jgi:hypothetical protein
MESLNPSSYLAKHSRRHGGVFGRPTASSHKVGADSRLNPNGSPPTAIESATVPKISRPDLLATIALFFFRHNLLFIRDANTTSSPALRVGHRCGLVFHYTLDHELFFAAVPARRNERLKRSVFQTGDVFILCDRILVEQLVGCARRTEPVNLSPL